MEVEGEPPELPAGVNAVLFRITQEALTNIQQHASPRSCRTGPAKERAVAEKHRIAQAMRCFDR